MPAIYNDITIAIAIFSVGWIEIAITIIKMSARPIL